MKHGTKPLTKRMITSMKNIIERNIEFQKKYNSESTELRRELDSLRRVYHEVPAAIELVNEQRRIARDKGLVFMDGRVGPAIESRNLCEYVGAEKLITACDFDAWDGAYKMKYHAIWYCKPWFADFLNKVKGENRKKFYKRMEELKAIGDKDELDAELGLLVLHSMED